MNDKTKNNSIKKNNRILFLVFSILIVIVIFFAFLNKESVIARKNIQDDKSFIIKDENDLKIIISINDIENLGLEDVEANYKPSDIKTSQLKIYTGVPFIKILEANNIDYTKYKSATFQALDGYASGFSIDKVVDVNECWIIIKEDGEYLKLREDGGRGPIRMILPKDNFSQNWVSYLMEVELFE